jgi:hypothetical protein
MLKAAGIVLLIVLILVGALMPLRYTRRMDLPRRSPGADSAARRPRDSAD